ncbi:MAG: type II/IV secretion system protein [Rhodothermales bacterium]|nr:type II/IV secretion system protein [Rhodothermales bacterium]
MKKKSTVSKLKDQISRISQLLDDTEAGSQELTEPDTFFDNNEQKETESRVHQPQSFDATDDEPVFFESIVDDQPADYSVTDYENGFEAEAVDETPAAPASPDADFQNSYESDPEKDKADEFVEFDDVDAGAIISGTGLDVRDRVVNQLLTKGLIDKNQLYKSWEEWKRVREDGYRISLWRVLTLDPDLDRELIYEEAARVYAFKPANVSKQDALTFLTRVADSFEDRFLDKMVQNFLIPISQEADPRTGERKWIFTTHDPTRPEVHKLLRDMRIKRFELTFSPEAFVVGLVTEGLLSKNEYLERLNADPLVYDLGMTYEEPEIDEEKLDAEINRSSLINLFEATLVEAVNRGASDVHIFPNAKSKIEIHFRVDGELVLWHKEERIHPEAMLAVVKDNSMNVDRFERDTAQDGFIQRKVADTVIRFRVSVIPIATHTAGINAESIVIRVLDDRKVLTDISKVGMQKNNLDRFNRAIRQPYGMIILTGPTGSGKSTTLVAALHQVITPKVNVLTIEDPVEYLIKGVRQVKLSHNLDMGGALRSLLRHDPDIVMVGEMRDKETAELAIKLANTGHVTFSTLHTNDAPSAVSRLYKMGIEPFLIAYAINMVVAQRLMRKLCSKCKVPADPRRYNDQLMAYLGFTDEDRNIQLFTAPQNNTCPECSGGGYRGRRAITETLDFSDSVRSIILQAKDMIDEGAIRKQAIEEGMMTLKNVGKLVVLSGESSIEELVRVTGL